MIETIVDYVWVEPSTIFDVVLISMYFVPVAMLNAYGLAKAVNVFRAMIATALFTSKPTKGGTIQPGEEPMVTIQICSFNEGNVIEDTINAACTVDWPKDKLSVQVLDDSTDETVMIIEALCQKWREQGLDCARLSRLDRVGYKAGILHHHTPSIKGDFVGMFDADHRCENQFLRRCVAQFYDDEGNSLDNIGCVQCPWAYYNVHDNVLTEYDGLNLDTAFVIEQTARSAYNQSFSFNGTGGIWRKAAIQAGGGWSWDTITEDLDLSYESYMAGYRFVFLRDLPQQLELPAGIRAHIQQKFRWTKGFWQVTRKTLFRILMNRDTPVRMKFEVFFQYTGAFAYTLTLLATVMAPVVSYRGLYSPLLLVFTILPVFSPLVGGICTIFGKVSGSGGMYQSFWSRVGRLRFLPTLMIFAMGTMVFETYAIYSGLASDDATFVRTPKKGTPLDGEKRLDYENDDDECVNDETAEGERTPTNESDSDRLSDDVLSVEGTEEVAGNSRKSSSSCFRWPRCCCFYSKLSPKGQKFLTNLTNGIVGILLGCYYVAWVGIFVYEKIRKKEAYDLSTYDDLMILLLPLPSLGLFYVHGSFTYYLLAYKISKRRERRLYAGVEKKGEKRVDYRPFARFWSKMTLGTDMDTTEFLSRDSFEGSETASTDQDDLGSVSAPVSESKLRSILDSCPLYVASARSFGSDEESIEMYDLEAPDDQPQKLPDHNSFYLSLTMPDLTEHKAQNHCSVQSLGSFQSFGAPEENTRTRRRQPARTASISRYSQSRRRVYGKEDSDMNDPRSQHSRLSFASQHSTVSFNLSNSRLSKPTDVKKLIVFFEGMDEAAIVIQSAVRAMFARIKATELVEKEIIKMLKADPSLLSSGIVDLELLPLHPVGPPSDT